MNILLLSAYDADSHRYWHQSLVKQFPEHLWTVLTLPGRYFSWRIRGNSLSWAFGEQEKLTQPYDLIIATSMTDLSALRGMCPSLAQIPTTVYFHENQFAYPSSGQERKSVEPQILNLYTALCADKILFNSDWNKQSLLEGIRKLLKKLPDHVPPGVIEHLEQRSQILPVPLSSDRYIKTTSGNQKPLQIIWNHRWEFDKGPQLLLSALEQLQQQALPFKLHLVGQQFRHTPEPLQQLRETLKDHLGCVGYVESFTDYQELLSQADVVLSTALHDFQGISVLEGIAAGCIPVVPDRLAYRELIPEEFRYADDGNETENLVEMLKLRIEQKEADDLPQSPNIDHLSWANLREEYNQLIENLTG